MTEHEFSQRAQQIKTVLFKTAKLYLGNDTEAIDAVDETVYKGLVACKKLRQPEYFTTWMTRILINTCNAQLKRRKRERPHDILPETAVVDYDALPLREAIAKLEKGLREVVILRYFTGLTLEETAETLGIPRGTVTSRQKKALALLRLELEEP